jgi:hypothetical protein
VCAGGCYTICAVHQHECVLQLHFCDIPTSVRYTGWNCILIWFFFLMSSHGFDEEQP